MSKRQRTSAALMAVLLALLATWLVLGNRRGDDASPRQASPPASSDSSSLQRGAPLLGGAPGIQDVGEAVAPALGDPACAEAAHLDSQVVELRDIYGALQSDVMISVSSRGSEPQQAATRVTLRASRIGELDVPRSLLTGPSHRIELAALDRSIVLVTRRWSDVESLGFVLMSRPLNLRGRIEFVGGVRSESELALEEVRFVLLSGPEGLVRHAHDIIRAQGLLGAAQLSRHVVRVEDVEVDPATGDFRIRTAALPAVRLVAVLPRWESSPVAVEAAATSAAGQDVGTISFVSSRPVRVLLRAAHASVLPTSVDAIVWRSGRLGSDTRLDAAAALESATGSADLMMRPDRAAWVVWRTVRLDLDSSGEAMLMLPPGFEAVLRPNGLPPGAAVAQSRGDDGELVLEVRPSEGAPDVEFVSGGSRLGGTSLVVVDVDDLVPVNWHVGLDRSGRAYSVRFEEGHTYMITLQPDRDRLRQRFMTWRAGATRIDLQALPSGNPRR